MFFVPLVANAQGVAPQFVYSTDSPGSHDIWISLNPVSGVPTEVAGSPFDERLSPVAMAASPAGTLLFVANPDGYN
jgi:hypothetical protein